ncbi:hypothetical protein MMC12_006985 [Toensbergia leucococca]|nr:hypothetical protein [Toensbergia leucococca]
MPTHAILGATGLTGRSLVTQLSASSKTKLNLYVRNKAALLTLFPSLPTNPNVNIFTGSLTDTPLLTACFEDVDNIFVVIGSNANTPGMRIAQQAAHVIVAALCNIRTTNPSAKMPKIIFLSSASMNPRLSHNIPAIGNWIVHTSLSYLYADLGFAEDYLRLHDSWLKVTFVQPGALVEDVQQGHELSLDNQKSFLSYPDLAAGMIEMAEKGGYDWDGVCVIPKGDKTRINYRVPIIFAEGLLWHYIPWLYSVCKMVGLK